jgi:hypothetical protein
VKRLAQSREAAEQKGMAGDSGPSQQELRGSAPWRESGFS